MARSVLDLLAGYRPRDAAEALDVRRTRELARTEPDPWRRALPLHVTASALVVHPATARVLLRWHARQRGWLQVGGHGDPGETDPLAIALREGREETGLPDLQSWPAEELVQAVICKVPAQGEEPAHEHADLRFVLATSNPEAARPEKPEAPLRWLSLDEARALTTEANMHDMLSRVAALLAG